MSNRAYSCVSRYTFSISFCHGHLLCRSQVRPYPLLHSLTMFILVFQPAFCLQLYTPCISSPSPHHMSIPSQSTTSNDSCDRLNSNQPSQLFICPSVVHGDTTHLSNHLHLCSFNFNPASTSKDLVLLP